MWAPSLAYVAALERIAAGGAVGPVLAAELVLVDVVVLSIVEVPLLLYAAAPARSESALRGAAAVLVRVRWPVAAAAAAAGGCYFAAHGSARLW